LPELVEFVSVAFEQDRSFLQGLERLWKLRWHLASQNFDGVIDGGANVGEFAKIARTALPQADLLCVELHPECAAKLRQGGLRVVEAALWKEPFELRLSLQLQREVHLPIEARSRRRIRLTVATDTGARKLQNNCSTKDCP
jgi:hypothetical protein